MSTQKELDEQLIDAASWGETEKVQALLAAGADVNAANKEGMTALMLAAVNNRTETVKALLEAGANANARKKAWDKIDLGACGSAVMLALAGGSWAVYWLTSGAWWQCAPTALMCSLWAFTCAERAADSLARKRHGWTALMFAAERGHTAAALALVEAGADVNVRQNAWSGVAYLTALFLAVGWALSSVLSAIRAATLGEWGMALCLVFGLGVAIFAALVYAHKTANTWGGWTALMLAAADDTETARAIEEAARKRAGKPEAGRG